MTFAFAKVGVEDAVAGTVGKTLIQRFISPFAIGTHPTDIANTSRVLTATSPVARGIQAVAYFGKENSYLFYMRSKKA